MAEPAVISCHIYPGITGHMLSSQIEAVPTCRAVIISAYGSGNLPISERSGMLEALKKAVEREILVVVLSQCTSILLLERSSELDGAHGPMVDGACSLLCSSAK